MSLETTVPWWLSAWPLFNVVLSMAYLIAGIYLFILVVKLAHLGIKALEIYIEKNK
jgi:hypothetical protein